MKIYTRGGDGGETVLIGGIRVRKDEPRVAAYGAVDELNATLGVALALDAMTGAADDGGPREAGDGGRGGESRLDARRVSAIQEDLFTIGARLASVDPERARGRGTIPGFDPARIGELEAWIDELEEDLPELDAFVLPGGSPAGAQLHVARTVCRRAERNIVGLLDDQPDLAEVVIPYVNRLSDLLFTLARWANGAAGIADTTWLPQRRRAAAETDIETVASDSVETSGPVEAAESPE